ncbi:bromodomain adjacent to zinc finger domain protein 2B isoform X1 [Pygocentrus nattereri]|uniref:bromodomain adjacent to zinc finger domain protein 2B isoform X1 n=1 Tax=Pygocentrus nattereri TaxID=42514 RepID=UPI0008149A4F|nr:bromodomain adjacent to zinc finger domain protein 2B isoform X1 [Pygocentrus nattereri]
MESRERLSPTHPQPSIRSTAPHSASSPNQMSKSGHLFQVAGDSGIGMSVVSSAFPMVSHPVFSIYSTLSGRSHFGGLGTLGLPAALTSHPQLGTFPDWWRASDAQVHGAAALFPPLLGLPPLFTPPTFSTDPTPGQPHTPSKSTQASAKGLNGTVNGNGKSTSSRASSASSSPSPALMTSEQSKTPKPRLNPQTHSQILKPTLTPQNHNKIAPKLSHHHLKTHKSDSKPQHSNRNHKIKTGQVQEKSSNKKEKKLCKTMVEISSNSDSRSGCSSDSSSDSLSSLDSADLDDEDDEGDEDGALSIASEDSDSDHEQRVKKKVKYSTQTSRVKDDIAARADVCSLDPHSSLLSSFFSRQTSSQPLTLSQASPLLFQNSRPRVEASKHTSVIQATGLAASSKPLPLITQDQGTSSRPPTSSKPLCLALSPKTPSLSSSPKNLSISSFPKPLSLCLSPKLCSVSPAPKPLPSISPKPPSLSSSPKPDTLSPSPRPKNLAPSPRPSSPRTPSLLPESLRVASRSSPEKPLQHTSDFAHLKQEPFRPPQLREHQKASNPLKKSTLRDCRKLRSPHSKHQHSNLFLSSTLLENSHPNGVIQGAVQDAPLDLITKPRSHSSGMPDKASLAAASPCFNTPINLTTGTKEHLPGLVTPNQTSTSPRLSSRAAQRKASRPVHRAGTNSQLLQSLVELARETESDITSSKDSDDSALDEDEAEDEIDKDSDDSLTDSGSNLVSDSDDDDDDDEKEEEEDKAEEMETDTENERTPVRLTKGSTSLTDSTSKMVTSSSSLNLHIHNLPSMSVSTAVTSSGTPVYPSTPSSSYSLPTPLGSRKRRRVTDERALRRPLEYGWQRETRIMTICGRVQGEVAYYAPCGKKLKQYPDVMKYLVRNGISEITRDHFSFSAKIRVGDFYEAREGPEGLQWYLLKDDEVIPRILAMEGRRGRPKNLEHQHPADTSGGNPLRSRHRKTKTPNSGEAEAVSAADAKVLRRLEAQEIARQAAQIKLMRKLEKQALARAAKEAKRQQALLAAEEKRKQKEQLKILKQQEKIRRIQQIRMEKEIRAQQILEAKRKKKEEAANAKIQEAEKRIKEKELRRQQAMILKHQELERHRLDMVWERERRRQHMLLMKAMEARKKAEERERLKQEKRDEKRLNKERKLELRRLELEMAKELNKPNEDLSLADQKPLPELSRLPGLLLPGSCFADCLMVMQFLRCFGKVLGLDSSTELPTLHMLQSGLLNLGPSVAHLQDLLVRLLSAAVCDPGLPPGHRAKTALGEHLSSVGINRENVSEILQIYMAAHCSQTELLPLVESLKTKAFQAHTPVQKASILAFLVNELACSKNVVTEIDKNIDHMTNLRREKWVIEGSLRKLRSIYAKRTGKRESSVGNEETHVLGTPSSGRKRKRKTSASEDDDDEDDDTDEGELEDDEEEEGLKKGKRTETFEEEDDGDQTDSVEELERKIEKLTKQQSQIRRKLFESSHSLRSMMFGQDRYKRRYWVLPQCGGVFIEGMESGEGPEELQRERDRLQNAQHIQVKEEPMEVPADKPPCASPDVKREVFSPGPKQEKDSLNLFLQKPGSFSKLSKLLEVAKLSPEPSNHTQGPLPFVGHLLTNTQATLPNSFSSTSTQGIKSELSAPLLSPAYLGNLQQQLHSDQLYRTLTEKNAHWFSLLPRSPCDNSSLAASPTPPPSSSSPEPCSAKPQSTIDSNTTTTQPHSSLSSNSNHSASNTRTQSPSCLSNNISRHILTTSPFPLAGLQMKPGIHMMGLPFCHWPTGLTSLNMTFGGMSTSPTLGEVYADAEANGNGGLLQTPSVGTCKTESPVLSREKPPEALSPALEMAKNQDLPFPLPIPEEMLTGWWKVSSFEELSSIVNVCHPRGIREKVLQKQIQKHMDYVMQVCAKNKDAAVIDLCELEESQVCKETVEGWCVEEHAMDLDIVVLQQVEELERRVTSASLQVKGWMPPEPQSEREDLVYFQHKAFGENDSEPLDKSETGIVRHANNPLDIAVARLSELERNIERRYLKSPLSTTIQITLDNVGTVTVPAPAPSPSADGDGGEEDLAPGMKQWRKAVSEVRSGAQLSLCLQQLQRSIAWERSIMKVYCQMCRKGDNEELLLLCDGCDKGCHTYCHKPQISTIPEGDWFCPACIAKASDSSQKSKKQASRPSGGGKKTSDIKRNKKACVTGEASEDDTANTSASSTPKKGVKETKKRKTESLSTDVAKEENSTEDKVKKVKTVRDNSKDLELCRLLLAELQSHQDAWPFMTPVNPKSVPGYRKVIKKPMDFSTIREKLSNSLYQNLETFIIDVNLVFDNCEKFNEDNSDIGRAGHNMRRFFQQRWTELLKQINYN